MEQQQKKSIDDKPLTFGKYKGKTPNELLEEDPGYLVWMMNNFENGVPFTPVVMRAAEKEYNHLQAMNDLEYDHCYGLSYGDTC